MIYSVVLLDGKELHCLSLDDIKKLYFNRQLNQESLCFSMESGQWQMLKREFDLSDWIPETPPTPVSPFNPFRQETTPPNDFDAQQDAAIHQQTPPESNRFVTFNQFPQNQTSDDQNFYAQNSSNGYSQNNQTETYYQAETTQTSYNFQNNQTEFAPSQYSNPANSYSAAKNFNPPNDSVQRKGLRQASVFLSINAVIYIFVLLFENFVTSSTSGESAAYKSGSMTGSIIPIVIDLILAAKLWKLEDTEKARKWVLIRAYFGFTVYGLIVPLISFSNGGFFLGVFLMMTTFFYFISLALTLHGKENPSQGRLIFGGTSFAVYFFIMFAALGLGTLGTMLPKLDRLKNSQIAQYKIEGKEFQDKTTGAKVLLPEGWSMISLDNPLIHTPEARMIAVDNGGNRLTMLEVVPVPGNLDMKRADSAFILEQISNNVVKSLKEQVESNAGFSKSSFNEVTRLSIYVGKHPAKLLVFDKIVNGEKSKGHLIITYDELTFYVLHSWCPAEEYETAQNDFKFFETNFTVPQKNKFDFHADCRNA